MMALPVLFTLSIVFLYFLAMFLLFLGQFGLRELSRNRKDPGEQVTILVPFRNEAEHLPALVGDLRKQCYPGHLFSVILVDDHSTDGSAEAVGLMLQGDPRFTMLTLPPGQFGKKEALGHAMEQVKSPWVIQIDADCRIGEEYIAAHMAFLAEHPSDLVAGMVTTGRGTRPFLTALERLDVLALSGAGAASFPLGRPLMCNGSNLLYSTSLYLETREHDPLGRRGSGDDMFLLIAARKLKRRMVFNPARKAMVTCHPGSSLKALLEQRMRWGAKSVHYRMADLQALAVLVVLACLAVLLSPLWVLLHQASWPWFLFAVGMKMLADLLVLVPSAARTGQVRTLWWFLPVWLIYHPFLAYVSLASLFGRPSWKGRKI
jgi:cellulose synthase/poly-beta-1,6-N-acetylglucosamine synthase-like glycosyltransferase